MTQYSPPEYPNTPLYKVGEVISNILADDFLLSKICFSSHDPDDHSVSEMYESSEWHKIVKEITSRAADALPIGVLVFYDDFRKYRVLSGSCGGLYMSIVNMD